MSKLMTIKDATKFLALSDSMVRKLVRSKQLTVVYLGRSVRIPVHDVDALIARAAVPKAVSTVAIEEDTDVDG